MQDTRNFHSGWNIDTLCIFLDLAIGADFLENAFLILLLICAGRWTT